MQGKVVLVTGGARRIGRAIALDLASHGAQVAVHYRSSEQEARATASEAQGKEFQADLSDISQIARLFGQVHDHFGRLDYLVNNAAVYFKTPLLETTEQQWDQLHDANLKAVYFCTQAAARVMLQQGGGRIVNLSSMGALRPWSGYAPYNASKAGVAHLTRSLAKELAPTITVNSVAPGVIEFSDEHEPEVKRMIESTPLRRHGTGEEVAEAVRFFLDGPGFVTGQVLAVDGGLTLKT